MAIPGYDMFRLFLMRIFNAKNPFIGDLNHIHHIIKFSSTESIALLITLSLICIPLFLYFFQVNLLTILVLQFFLYLAVIIIFKIKNEKNKYR